MWTKSDSVRESGKTIDDDDEVEYLMEEEGSFTVEETYSKESGCRRKGKRREVTRKRET